MSTGHWWNDTESKRKKYCEQTLARSFCIHHWAGLAINPAFRGEITVTSRLNHGRPWILVRFPVVTRDLFFSSPKPPEQLWGRHVLTFSGYRESFRGIKRSRWKLTAEISDTWSNTYHIAIRLYKVRREKCICTFLKFNNRGLQRLPENVFGDSSLLGCYTVFLRL